MSAPSVEVDPDVQDDTLEDDGPTTLDDLDLAPVPWTPVTSGAAWFAVTAAVLCGVSPLLLVAATPADADAPTAWVGALLLTVAAGARYSWLVARGERRVQELLFWLFTYVFLGLAPLAQLRSEQYPGTTPDLDPGLHGTAVWVCVIGTAAFVVGLAVAGDRPLPLRRPGQGDIAVHRLVALSAFALLACALYVSQVGVPVLFSSRAERNDVESALWGDPTVRALVTAVSSLPLVVALVGLLRLRSQRRARGEHGPSVLPWTVLAALLLVVNPVSSPRYVVGTAALALLAALGFLSSPKRLRLFAVLLAAGLVLVFPHADVTRRADTGEVFSGGPARSLASSDFDAFAQVNNTVAYVRDEGAADGRQLLGAALFWVPRSVWPDKPRDTGILLADYRDYSFDNLSAPLVAELHVNGGWLVLVLGMVVVGAGVRRLDQHNVAATGPVLGTSTLATIVPFYSIIVLRGSLLQSMAGLSVLTACALFVTRRSDRLPRPVPATPARRRPGRYRRRRAASADPDAARRPVRTRSGRRRTAWSSSTT